MIVCCTATDQNIPLSNKIYQKKFGKAKIHKPVKIFSFVYTDSQTFWNTYNLNKIKLQGKNNFLLIIILRSKIVENFIGGKKVSLQNYNKLFRKVEKTIATFKMFYTNDTVLIGLSGGSDSVALLHILLTLKDKLNIEIGVAHLNHCLRNEESDRDEQFVFEIARKFNLPFYCEKIDVKQFCCNNKLSLEEGARQVRYEFFEKIAHSNNYSKIAVGHHADDNAELILMNMLRGSGMLGLCGIPPVRDLKIVRPLIEIPKLKLLDFLKLKNISYITDSSNNDQKFLRNKVRISLIPFIKENFNPSIEETLNRTGAILREEEQWLDKIITPIFKDAIIKKNDNKIGLLITAFKEAPLAAIRRIIRMAIQNVKGNLKSISQIHVDAVIVMVKKNIHGKSLDLPDRIQAKIHYGNLIIVKQNYSLRAVTKKS